MIKIPKVSIVVPVYNGVKYLPTLYEKLHNQTYENIEIIMVDDMSTDGSYLMMKEFEASDARFKVIKVGKKGGCAVKAQVQGLPYCTGEYYFYASQDDFFDYDIIEKCVNKAMELDADIVLPNMVLYYEGQDSNKHGKYPINNNYDQILSGKEAFLLSLNWEIHAFALRKMSLFEFEPFRADYYNSEEYYFRCMLLYAKRIAFCDSNFYYRQDNPDAITKTIKYFHVDILLTDMMLFNVMYQQDYSKKMLIQRLKEITINWCRYCKRFMFNKLPEEQQEYVDNALNKVRNDLIHSWWNVLRMSR